MANLNDFKLVNSYSTKLLERMFKTNRLEKFNNLTESNRKRFGFYYLILQLTTGNTTFEELEKMIIDSDYCNTIFVKNLR